MKAINHLKELLTLVESDKSDKMSIDMLSRRFRLSGSHLQRLFKMTTGQPIMEYIRGRKLAHSLDTLFNTDLHIIDIANEYGFQHEQSYIRAFIKEFGSTPGQARKAKLILPVRERINPKDLQSLGKGIIYGPEIVMMPSFNIIGKPHVFTDFNDRRDALEPNKLAVNFAKEAENCIPNMIIPVIYIGYINVLSKINNIENVEYMPSVLVDNLSCVPNGFKGMTIPMHQCVRFRYIGEHHYEEITMVTARSTYNKIHSFFSGQTRYTAQTNYFIEWLDISAYNGTYCKMEWLFPVSDTLK
ncbi:MAG: AraC family transcriptional regulator [Treponema sp.]|nr:AraC family transcriptional regulator [Treponema sp.]